MSKTMSDQRFDVSTLIQCQFAIWEYTFIFNAITLYPNHFETKKEPQITYKLLGATFVGEGGSHTGVTRREALHRTTQDNSRLYRTPDTHFLFSVWPAILLCLMT